jgi:hypothetical protein
MNDEFEGQDRDVCRLVQRLILSSGADYALIRISDDSTACCVKLSRADGKEVTRVGKTLYETFKAASDALNQG